MRVSVALATFNGEKHLEAQLSTLTSQSLLPDELVISDDGSSDNTVEIANAFSQYAPFLVTVLKSSSRCGYAANFGHALNKTSGDLIFLCDQDDFWLPEKVEKVVSAANDKPETLLFMHDAAIVDANLNPSGATKLQKRRVLKVKSPYTLGCTMALRRELLELCLPFPVQVRSHDNWVELIARHLNSKHVLEECLMLYRRHSETVTSGELNMPTLPSKHRYLKERLRPLISNAATRTIQLDQLEELKAAHNRLCSAPPEIVGRELLSAVGEACTRLEMDIHTAMVRLSVRERSRMRRVPEVLRLVASGFYKPPLSISNAIRDLFFR